MNLGTNPNLWLQEKFLQEACHEYNIEQEMYWVSQAHHNWIALGAKNTKFFQTAATIRKRYNVIYKTIY